MKQMNVDTQLTRWSFCQNRPNVSLEKIGIVIFIIVKHASIFINLLIVPGEVEEHTVGAVFTMVRGEHIVIITPHIPVALPAALHLLIDKQSPVIKAEIPAGINVPAKSYVSHGTSAGTQIKTKVGVRWLGVKVSYFIAFPVKIINFKAWINPNVSGYPVVKGARRRADVA